MLIAILILFGRLFRMLLLLTLGVVLGGIVAFAIYHLMGGVAWGALWLITQPISAKVVGALVVVAIGMIILMITGKKRRQTN